MSLPFGFSMLRRCVVAAMVFVVAAAATPAWAQFGFARSVGGVSISVDGVLSMAPTGDAKKLREEMIKSIKEASGELKGSTELRMVSLKGLDAAIAEAVADGKPLSEEIRFLAGLQRVQFVFVYPEHNDIVIAGPAEGWHVGPQGTVVGVTTGLPVVQLEDLIVAFRSVEEARRGGITCSIDPTQEGMQEYTKVESTLNAFSPAAVSALEKAMGMQSITVTGVASNTNFARVLVAADYRMKRLAMEFDKAPVPGIPSYLSMVKSGKINNAMPRWWLACNYEPVSRTEDHLGFELKGVGVKAMTADDHINNDGSVTRTGKASPQAQRWAEKLTEKYGALAAKDPVFGELRNAMDLCVIAALIRKEGLMEKAGCELPTLTMTEMKLESGDAPKVVPTKCAVTGSGRGMVVLASGGVEINSWQVADKTEVKAEVASTREQASPKASNSWWWQ